MFKMSPTDRNTTSVGLVAGWSVDAAEKQIPINRERNCPQGDLVQQGSYIAGRYKKL